MSSNPMVVVSSTANHAELNLITVLLLLVMVPKVAKISSLLETHGVPHGERKDISESLPLTVKVSAVSKWSQLFQSSEQ
jgi:hypothetical protein